MADSIVIRYATKNLERATAFAKDIAAKVKAAAREIKDVEVRKKFLGAQKEIAKERQAEIDAQARMVRLQRRADKLGEQVQNARAGFDKFLGQQKQLKEKGLAMANAVMGGNLGGGVSVLGEGLSGMIPGLGPIAGVVAAVVGVVIPELQKLQAQADAARDARIRALVAQHLERADFAARLERDVDFRNLISRRAADQYLATERAQKIGGWHPRSGRLVELN